MPHAFSVQIVEQIDSTNSALLRALEQRDCHGEVLMARQQTAGRGQRGRRWHGRPGDALMFSLAWRFPIERPLEGLSLAVGSLVADALAPLLYASGHALTLKWPNDILVDDQHKLGGILIEIAPSPPGARGRTAVIGIGINLAPPQLPPDAEPLALPATGLNHYLHQPQTPDAILAVLLPRLWQGLQRFDREGFAAFQAQWWARRSFARSEVHIIRPQGEPLAGHIHALTAQGALVIRSSGVPTTLHTLISGEVRVRAAS